MKKILIAITALLTFVFVLFAILIIYLKLSTEAQTTGKLNVPGLTGPVTIYRDANGIPHINAKSSDADAFFALGFVHAQDRLWQMEFQRRIASGTLSEVFGKKTLEMDKYLRVFNFYQASQLTWDSVDSQTKKFVRYYTAGVNAFIQQGTLPIEFTLLRYQPKPWTVLDSISWQKMMAWNLQRHSWLNKIDYALVQQYHPDKKIQDYYPEYPKDAPLIAKPMSASQLLQQFKTVETNVSNQLNMDEHAGKGSNSWVLAGTRTTTGKPILANDVHLGLSAPGLWYLVEMRGPTIHITGASIPGLPTVGIGHNDHIAWGVTNGYNDSADLYILQPKDKITERHEKINVRGSTPIDFIVYNSNYGPIINAVTPSLAASQQKIALQWTALSLKDTTLESFIRISLAQNWSGFTAALQSFVTPTQNFIYADTAGNIGYYFPGMLPIRKWESLTPVTTNPQFAWQGFIPFQALPHMLNPTAGYIASANNKIIDETYPYQINARWPIPPYRIERIVKLLQQKNNYSIQDMQQMQADTINQRWLQYRNYLLNIHPQAALSKKAFNILQNWNGDMNMDSPAPIIFAYWLNTFTDLLPVELPMSTTEPLFLYKLLQKNISESYLVEHFDQAVQRLAIRYGEDPSKWRWGAIHQAEFVGNGLGKSKLIGWFWNRKIPTPGGNYTINVGTHDPTTFTQHIGATYRQIIDLSDLENSLYNLPIGQSGNPLSKHYNDFMKKWRDVSYVKIKSIMGCPSTNNCLLLNPAIRP